MTNSEKIKLLRRKFVSATNNLETIKNAIRAKQPVPLQMVDEVITDVNIMGALFPIQFEDRYGKDEEPVVLINLRDPEGEPDQQTNAGRRILTASFARIIIEDIKFDALNFAIVYEPGKEIVEKYKPLLLEQAAWCLNHLLEWPTLGAWEKERLVIYANQLGYYTYTGEQDAGKLQQALEVLQVGYGYSDWRQHGYIKHTYVDVLLKLGRTEEAYAIIIEGLEYNENFEYFQEYKNDKQFMQWQQESSNEKAVAMRHKQQVKQELLNVIIAEE